MARTSTITGKDISHMLDEMMRLQDQLKIAVELLRESCEQEISSGISGTFYCSGHMLCDPCKRKHEFLSAFDAKEKP